MENGGGGVLADTSPICLGPNILKKRVKGVGGGDASRHNHLIFVNTKTWLSLGKSYCPSLMLGLGPKGPIILKKRRGGRDASRHGHLICVDI